MSVPANEGFLPFEEYRTFYRVVGDLSRLPSGMLPVLAVHGRPVSHEALQPLEQLAQAGRPVIFYDQLGCGRSDRPDNPGMWTISLFVDELAAVRRYLNLERVHLLGHSWGGAVAQEYALRSPAGLASLILASTFCDRSLMLADLNRLRSELPAEIYQTLLKHEAAGTTALPAYQQADKFFALRNVCRVDPWPEYLTHSLDHPPVGVVDIEAWNIRGRLNQVDVPTLVTCGRYDFCTPAHAELIHNGIRGSRLVIFEGSSHYPHIEETARYLLVLNDFLTHTEQQIAQK
jgi:proline-specific peptidase